jgi:hypothetical protein
MENPISTPKGPVKSQNSDQKLDIKKPAIPFSGICEAIGAVFSVQFSASLSQKYQNVFLK